MNLDLTETQSLLQETVRAYLAREVPLDRIRQLEKEGAADAALWKGVAQQGWLELPFACVDGGATLVDVGLLVEEFARRAAIAPIAEVAAASFILAKRAPGAAEWIDGVAAGDRVPVPAVLEEAARGGALAAEVRGGRLAGRKTFVDYGQSATHHLVAARGEGPGLYLVDAHGAGVACEPLRSIGRTPVCHVRYEGVPAERAAGAEAVTELVHVARALAAVQCVGSMQQALDLSVAYANVREQFGVTIGTFQAVRHHCANMAIRVASARGLAYEALDALGRGAASDAMVALAKASASRAAPEVTMLAHQIHGGNGVIEENDLYFHTLRAKERSLAWGSFDECMDVVAAQVHREADWL
ncbi:MAG TPA: acyl-CoA dehydrogenase family protein [Myxococcota bacterium]|nr:acyl-CoA dehydrogenase family protein [Myxococcota bacterium]